ncbi:PTS transporter subunit EIIC [Vibrio sp. MEBiC08052]|uniref:PTS transporter subunit EIIC n=1 Tax=Vibrio sp. MEBiC08052 TaxID=1761910 RepID=UPI0007406945|nr:PTS transporter subunit EIIC [Vibrio sp. MEBiC08052]KUI97140.1 PTS system N-acetylglucosamine-specific IIABC component [Vibrio sp. MEBiC08052]
MLNYFRRIGVALFVPVAVLPAAALLLGIGNWLSSTNYISSSIATLLTSTGLVILENMAALFAIGVGYGLSKDKNGSAALSAFVGFLIVTNLCSTDSVSLIGFINIDNSTTLAFNNINNQFVGIVIGIIAAETYNRFHNVELHNSLAFFSGNRLVPIITTFICLLISLVFMYLWPILFTGLITFGENIIRMDSVGAGIYAFFNRLLIPFGLQHALNAVFWFDLVGINDIGNFWAGQAAIDAGTAQLGTTGRYMAGFFPIMMFGLPGAALAIYHSAPHENRNKVASLLMSGVFASFFMGITEPIEFTFMFAAPLLYFAHALLTGLAVFIASSMQWIAGFGFSAGLFDFLLSSDTALANKPYMLILLGLLFFIVYYTIFRTLISFFDIQLFGQENSTNQDALFEDNPIPTRT